jgi:MYND finger
MCLLLRAWIFLQIGFISSDGEWAHHGVRYLILPASPPYRIGAWKPLYTSDLGSAWGGSQIWVRGQGAAVAKGIWFHRHFDKELEVSWSGMSDPEKEDLAAWLEKRAERLRKKNDIEEKEYEELKALHGNKHYMVEEKLGMDRYYKSLLACRAGCGEENPRLTCSKCKTVRYCNVACQREDWKVSLTYLLSFVPNLILLTHSITRLYVVCQD